MPPPGPEAERPRISLKGGAVVRYAEERFGKDAVERGRADQAVLTLGGPADAWTVSFALSFAGGAEVQSPPALRRQAADRIRRALDNYKR